MDGEHDPVTSRRLSNLSEQFHDKQYRDGYVAAHTRSVLARQMRNFRGDLSQGEFGELIGKRQTVVSRLENPSYGAWQLRTMFDVAKKMGVAVFVRFVDFPTFLKYSGDLSDNALRPQAYNEDAIEELAKEEEHIARESALKALFSDEPKQISRQSAREGAQERGMPQQAAFDRPITLPQQGDESHAVARLLEAAD
jgi:hypothetical protein